MCIRDRRTTVQVGCLLQRKRNTAKERVASPVIHQAAVQKRLAAAAEPLEIAAQAGPRCVTDTHSPDDGAVVDAAFGKVRLSILKPLQLPLIEMISGLQQLPGSRLGRSFGQVVE